MFTPLSIMELSPSTRSDVNIYVGLGGFVLGIFVSSLIFIPPLVAVFCLLTGVSILVAERIQSQKLSNAVSLIGIIFIAFALGSLRYAVKDYHEAVVLDGRNLSGVVVSEPEDRENSRRFVLETLEGEKVLVSAPLYTEVEYGDEVRADGSLKKPEAFENEETGRVFNYPEYLAKDDIYYTLSFAQVELVAEGKGNKVKAGLFGLKHFIVEKARSVLPEPGASLLLGLIIAGREALPAGVLEDFRRAGVIHIVVLSGFNVTLIAEFLRRVFQRSFLALSLTRFPLAPALASMLGVLAFIIMTGAESTVVRAGIMALVAIVAQNLGRNYSASRALFVAGVLMVIHNPKILVFDPSFQLSYLATLGLIYLSPLFIKWFKFVTEKFGLKEIVAQTISTQIAVLPFLIYSIGQVSIVSLPANLLILPIVPVVMFLGFVVIVLAFLIPISLVTLLAFPVHLLLSWIFLVSHTVSVPNFATLNIPPISGWLLLVFYFLLIFGFYKIRKGLVLSSSHN